MCVLSVHLCVNVEYLIMYEQKTDDHSPVEISEQSYRPGYVGKRNPADAFMYSVKELTNLSEMYQLCGQELSMCSCVLNRWILQPELIG